MVDFPENPVAWAQAYSIKKELSLSMLSLFAMLMDDIKSALDPPDSDHIQIDFMEDGVKAYIRDPSMPHRDPNNLLIMHDLYETHSLNPFIRIFISDQFSQKSIVFRGAAKNTYFKTGGIIIESSSVGAKGVYLISKSKLSKALNNFNNWSDFPESARAD